MTKTIRIATRQSPLALWQANFIKSQLNLHYPHLTIELIPMMTQGDIILDTPLAKIGGKGLFVKELERALLEKRADLAVHSMKDVPMELPHGLKLSTICKREDPRDAFISNHFDCLDSLPQGAIVGTSSLRRQAQIKKIRPDIEIKTLRGNLGTRLKKLDNNEYDAIILAASGLIRLGMPERIRTHLDTDILLPAAGQGALGIEIRSDDNELAQLLQPLSDPETTYCVLAERALNRHLQGGCQVPIAGFAQINATDTLTMRALVAKADGKKVLNTSGSSSVNEAEALGVKLAENLLTQGAQSILNNVSLNHD